MHNNRYQNKMLEVDKEYYLQIMANNTWSHAITITMRDADSLGEIWIVASNGIDNILQYDAECEAILFLSQDHESHVHAHGVLKTTLTHRQLKAAFGKGHCYFSSLHDPAGWFSYIIPQALKGAVITTHQLQELTHA